MNRLMPDTLNEPMAADTLGGPAYPVPVPEMRRRYMRLFAGAVNDVLRFKYKMHSSALPSDFLPLREDMVLAGQAFTVKGGPDITTDGEFDMVAGGVRPTEVVARGGYF